MGHLQIDQEKQRERTVDVRCADVFHESEKLIGVPALFGLLELHWVNLQDKSYMQETAAL